MGTPLPLPKGGRKIFDPRLWPNGWMDQDDTWHGRRPQTRRLCVRWGLSPLPKNGGTPLPNFQPLSIVAKRPHGSRCYFVRRQAPRFTRHCVIWGLSSEGEAGSPIFGQCPLWPYGWMDSDATWYGDRPRPRRLCVR